VILVDVYPSAGRHPEAGSGDGTAV